MGKSTRRLGLISSTNATMNLIITQQIGKKFSYRSRKGEAISTYEIMCISKQAFLNACKYYVFNLTSGTIVALKENLGLSDRYLSVEDSVLFEKLPDVDAWNDYISILRDECGVYMNEDGDKITLRDAFVKNGVLLELDKKYGIEDLIRRLNESIDTIYNMYIGDEFSDNDILYRVCSGFMPRRKETSEKVGGAVKSFCGISFEEFENDKKLEEHFEAVNRQYMRMKTIVEYNRMKAQST